MVKKIEKKNDSEKKSKIKKRGIFIKNLLASKYRPSHITKKGGIADK